MPDQKKQTNARKTKHLPLIIALALVMLLLAVSMLLREQGSAMWGIDRQAAHAAPTDSDHVRDLIDQRRLDALERAQQFQGDFEKRRAEHAANAQKAYDDARSNRNGDPAAFIKAASELASTIRSKEVERSSKLIDEAYNTYYELGKNSPSEPQCRAELWVQLGLLPYDKFQEKFERFFRTSEEKTPNPDAMTEYNGRVAQAIQNHLSRASSSRSEETKNLWSKAIEIRSSVRGETSPTLKEFLMNYGRACESQGDLTAAENAYVRAAGMNAANTPDEMVNVQVQLAQFYMRHQMFQKADAATAKVIEIAKQSTANERHYQIGSLLDNYARMNRPKETEKLVNDLLTIGGDDMVQAVDRTMNDLIAGYINNFNLTAAKAMLEKRVAASKTCARDGQALRWRSKLSDIDLALGLDAESNKLFDEVKTATALQGGKVDKLVDARKILIESLNKN